MRFRSTSRTRHTKRAASTPGHTRGRRAPARRIAVLLAIALAAPASVARAQKSRAELEAEIERLRIVVEVKQQKIELLERELEPYRAQEKAKRNRQIVADIQAQVERLRGLPAKQPLTVAPLTAELIDALLDKEIADRYTEEQFRGWENILKHLGLVPPRMELRPFLQALFTEQVAGLYDDETKKLYVSEKFDLESTIARIILAHEICHGLQDQYFDLTGSPIHAKTNDDRAIAALCAIEGDATLLMSEYLLENVSWKILLEVPGILMLDQQQMAAAPPFLSRSLLFPYLQGMNFITECVLFWGDPRPKRRDDLLRNFPRSSEQILHPRKYLGRQKDEPTDVALDALTSAGLIPSENLYDNVVGEFGIQAMLDEHLPFDDAKTAAAGWDGDRILFGGSPDGPYALAWLTVWDSAREAAEFADALARYFKAQRPALAEQTGGDAARLRWSDDRGRIVIASDGQCVACVHSDDQGRADRILEALLSVAAEVRVVP